MTAPVAREGALSPWADIVGPCYTDASLLQVLPLERDTLSAAVAQLDLLCLRTADGTLLFPAFQVRDDRVCPNLRPVLEILRSGVDDPWTWAQWLNTEPNDQPRPISRLWDGAVAEVLAAARHDAHAWRM